MVKFLKAGKCVLVLKGRYAGKKAVIVQNYDGESKSHPFGHALVAGVSRYPRKVTKDMSKKKVARRSIIKTFIKKVNYNHLMPTRYTLDLGEPLREAVPNDAAADVSVRKDAKVAVRKLFTERYNGGKNRWFFAALKM
ncbi:60S ribosomal protein L27-B [Porphyridium purpureum]|uniref:60S ribosomal protein L27-B n=1 Tax=Porphyridium purpureum TaxID=35688 RepID=A0A5J4YUQ8_PORPP|nr:60S ribosomal protein L27-B [Porphyridium purpureum]|eukprot:POR3648..scf227_4